jgi:hypothetical protein
MHVKDAITYLFIHRLPEDEPHVSKHVFCEAVISVGHRDDNSRAVCFSHVTRQNIPRHKWLYLQVLTTELCENKR